ncbi:hypothetical protein [Nocardia jejuensis]|uniref:hypothetical protein n=1 Tax=Nocardia jejuensis TaxID=328049 RepID=UPI000829ADFE|nr:hypothetical protein [Nocardia jejuensis]
MPDWDGSRLLRREAVLEEGNRLKARYDEGGYTAEGKLAISRVFELQDEYRHLLPEVLVARCPFTGTAISWPLDNADLDGWFWNRENPIRRLVNPVARTWLAMGGAIRLTPPVEPTPFPRMPGPDVPYVVPRILDLADVRAVVSEVPIGPHTGWAITYFAETRPIGVALENLWGSREYDVYGPGGRWKAWNEHRQSIRDYDFDLRPWLDSGKLLWIAPGDVDAILREGSSECPFVDIDGERRLQLIRNGEITRY